MKHVLLAIAAHCQPEVLKYTLGTWLETYDRSYKVSICVSLSTDFESVCKRADEILRLDPPVDIIRVPKYKHKQHEMQMFRFSALHANCLRAIFSHCQDIPFTHVAVLDHDLEFKQDFIKWAMDQNADWVGNLFRDRKDLLRLAPHSIAGANKPESWWAPKCSVWNCLLSRRLYDRIMEDSSVLMPALAFKNLVYDTMAKMFELMTCDWGMDVRIHKEADIEAVVKHLWSLSFDFGPNVEGHYEGLRKLVEDYNKRFPNGIRHLLDSLEVYNGNKGVFNVTV